MSRLINKQSWRSSRTPILKTTLMALVVIAFLCAPTLAKSDEIGLTQQKAEILKDLETRLNQDKQALKLVEKEKKSLNAELKKTKETLQKQTKSLHKNQTQLISLENNLSNLKTEEGELNAALASEHDVFVEVLITLARVNRTPPEALLASPLSIIDTARTHAALEKMVPEIAQKTKVILAQLNRLQTIKKTYAAQKIALHSEQKDLDKKTKALDTLIAKREAIYNKLDTTRNLRQKEIAGLVKEASSVKDLMQKLSEKETKFSTLSNKKKPAYTKPKKTASLPGLSRKTLNNAKTSGLLPVAGNVETAFGRKNAYGVTNKGVDITTRANAVVTTPISGRIKFSGPFKNYENIVIIHFDDGTTGLIGGLGKIHVRYGDTVKAGEPIGRVAKTSEKAATLYFEIRQKGRQIDPEKHLRKLAKKA